MAKRQASRRGGIGHPASRVMLIRQLHAYLSVFAAPTILFFAITGILQLYSLHEPHGAYQPPAMIEKLGRVHKNQTYSLGRKHRPSALKTPIAGAEGDWVKPLATHGPDDRDAPPPKTQALKALFAGVAGMLVVSSLLGVWMAVTQNRRKIVLVAVLLLGAAAPLGILLL